MFRRINRGKHRGEEGQSIVEAAYVIPLFILLLCGIIDFGWIFSNQLMVSNSSREGARYAVVNSQESNLTELVTERVRQVSGIGDPDELTVTVIITSDGDVEVTVTKTLKVLTPLAGIFVENQQVIIDSTSVMRIS